MDRIAVISDIHGNLPALDAVLKDLSSRNILKIICLGDMIGKGPSSAAVVDIIREKCEVIVKGNWEEFITTQDTMPWVKGALRKDQLSYLSTLPLVHEFYLSGKLVRLFHAHPMNVFKRTLYASDLEDRMALFEHFDNPEITYKQSADIVGYGDIHKAYTQHLNQKVLFNTGSVGNSLDLFEASYVIMEGVLNTTKQSSYSFQFIRVPYDIELAVQDALTSTMPEKEKEMYINEIRTLIYRAKQK